MILSLQEEIWVNAKIFSIKMLLSCITLPKK